MFEEIKKELNDKIQIIEAEIEIVGALEGCLDMMQRVAKSLPRYQIRADYAKTIIEDILERF